MNGPPVRLVIFDMDGVLCRYDRPRRVDVMAEACGVPGDRIVAAIWESGFDDEADRGGHTAESYLAEFNRRIGAELSRADWVRARKESMTPFPDVLDLARRVAARLPVALFTNNGPLLEDTLAETFPEAVAIFAPNVFFSHSLGASKPDPAAFRAVVDRMGGKPEETLFIDDSAEYVAGAREAGLRVHQFKDAEGLRACLASLDLVD